MLNKTRYHKTGSFKLVTGVLFSLMVAGVASLGILLFEKNSTSNESSSGLNRTLQALDQIEVVSALYKDVQLESNGLFISGDSTYISHYNNARGKIFDELNKVRVLSKGSPIQQDRLDTLETLLKDLITFSDSVLLMPRKGVYSESRLLSRIDVSQAFRTRISRIIDQLKIEEKRLLAIKQKVSEENRASFNQTFSLLLIVIFGLLATTFISIRYSFNKRFRAELELKKANDLFFKLFHESPVGMVISRSDDGRIIDCNAEYAELVNYHRGEIIGKTALDLKVFKNEGQVQELVAAARDLGTAKDIEVLLQLKEKGPLWVSISLQSIQIQDTSCILAAVLDMTSHKQAEEKIKKALAKEIELNKMKSNFVTLASHEFRTPLTAILSSAVLLEKYSLEGDAQRAEKHMGRIKSSVSNLTLILDEFLSVSKIEEEKISAMLEKIDLKEYLNAVFLSLKGSAKPAQKICYSHSGESLVWTDPVLVRNIVTNLVSNAIKYSEDGTNILVSSSVNGQIRISVKDFGIGIPKEDQKNLFNRFYRAANAGNVQGTGLGLHITKHYVEMLHGSIHVNSELGKGSEFEVILEPFEQAEHNSI